MRVLLPFAALCVSAATLINAQLPASGQGQSAGPGPGTDPTGILAAAREALGGDQKLAAVKAFVATGRTRQVRGSNLVPIEFEIACELPDKFVRRDEIPAQESGPTSSGFNGDALIQVPPPPEPPPQIARPGAAASLTAKPPQSPAAGSPPAVTPGSAAVTPDTPASSTAKPPEPARSGGPPAAPAAAPPDPRKARVTSLKQDFVRLTLGMFATSFSSYPLTFVLAGKAEAPQGQADVVDVKGPGNFTLRFLISSQTHLPVMALWTMPATNVVVTVPGQPAPENLAPGSVVVQAPPPPGAAATKEDQDKYAKDLQGLRRKALAQAKPVEYRIYFADYRDVGKGLMFPFRLRRAIAGETVEETNFDAFKINPRIDARKFEALK